jgi:hypothetical protein
LLDHCARDAPKTAVELVSEPLWVGFSLPDRHPDMQVENQREVNCTKLAFTAQDSTFLGHPACLDTMFTAWRGHLKRQLVPGQQIDLWGLMKIIFCMFVFVLAPFCVERKFRNFLGVVNGKKVIFVLLPLIVRNAGPISKRFTSSIVLRLLR